MEGDADDALELDYLGATAPAAFRDNRAVYGVIGGQSAADLRMTKYEHALLPAKLNSVIALPVYATREDVVRPRRILVLDSVDALEDEFKDAGFMKMLAEASWKVSRTFIDETIGQVA